jgi:hypothetical protein
MASMGSGLLFLLFLLAQFCLPLGCSSVLLCPDMHHQRSLVTRRFSQVECYSVVTGRTLLLYQLREYINRSPFDPNPVFHTIITRDLKASCERPMVLGAGCLLPLKRKSRLFMRSCGSLILCFPSLVQSEARFLLRCGRTVFRRGDTYYQRFLVSARFTDRTLLSSHEAKACYS